MTEDFRQTAPQPLDPVSFDIARPHETELANGLKVVVFENRRLPLVNFKLAFLTGEAEEGNRSIGIASAMTSMLNEGTRSYTSRQLAEEVERLGASISASASADFMLVSASGLSFYTQDVLRLLAEIVLYPTFPEGELNLYKTNTIENLKFQRSQPDFLAGEQMSRILYGEHPYAVAAPKPADIEKISKQAVQEFHQKTFIPNNAILIVVGDIETDDVLSKISDKFATWKGGAVEKSEKPSPPVREKRTLTIVDRPGSAQSNIVLGNLAIERTNPDFFPVLVMNQVLGAGASSRIFMNLREEKGYTYGAYSRVDTKKLAGEFEATAEVRTSVTGESLKEFFYELNRIRDEQVPEEELSDAKNFLAGVFPIRAETQEGLTNLIVSQMLYGLPDDYLQTYRDKINAVSVADVQRVAKQYIEPEKMAVVIVGDGEEVLAQAGEYADEIEIFDTDGNPKNLEKIAVENEAETAEISGEWSLTLDFQGQNFPVSISLEKNGESYTGQMESMLGEGEIKEVKIRGTKFSATAATAFQGQNIELNLTGTAENDSMTGTVSAPFLPGPIDFSGVRKP